MKRITSAQNPRLRNAIRLKATRGRKIQRRIIVFGLREVKRAVASPLHPLEVFLCSDLLSADEIASLQDSMPDATEFYDLPEKLMQRLKYGDRSVSVVVVAQRPDLALERLVVRKRPLIVILDAIEKPGNIGAVLRSIDGAGASGLILTDPLCDVLHPNCIRASLGSVFTVPIAIASASETIGWCRKNSIAMYAAKDAAVTQYMSVDMTDSVAVAFGNEANGLSDAWNEDDISAISIPMQGISDSLNVSVAAAIILYEIARQRGE